jgi:prepilin-type N-terminal cleavage/methylation domain-containing protein
MSRHRHPRGFTLVELLVVIGIIAILMALLTPAVMWGINAGRRTRMGVEIAALNDAIEKYKSRVGDYPPNFRDYNAFIRHVRTRYPKINVASLNVLIVNAYGPGFSVTAPPGVNDRPRVDEGESLVFWLALTRNDPQYPFNPTGTAALQTYYEFDQRRLVDVDGDSFPSYRAAFAKDTFYLYLDSRSYDELADVTNAATDPTSGAYAEIDATVTPPTHQQVVRPYFWSESPTPAFMNPTSFQILCAGQDGEWGNVDPLTNAYAGVKTFPGGLNYTPQDRDNITNFSEGRTLEDHIP